MKTLVLVGGGHAHLYCLEQIQQHTFRNWQIILISPSVHHDYSGMLSGFTEGFYSMDDIRIDLKRLSEKTGAKFIADQIVKVDAEAKQLLGEQGAVYPYDLVSFDIGSATAAPPSIAEQLPALKPNYHLPEHLLRIRDAAHPLIVGGGASGVELAFTIHAWRRQRNLPLNSVLVSSSSLLSNQGPRAVKTIEAIAKRKGLLFVTGETIERLDDRKAVSDAARVYPKSDILWMSGPASPRLFVSSGIVTDPEGFLLVNEELQSVEHADIYGAGDCISRIMQPAMPKNGVFAIRQAPILWHNLKSRMSSGQLITFVPPKRYLSIISTGNSEAFLSYGKFLLHGRIPWLIKKAIDRSYLKRYKKIYE